MITKNLGRVGFVNKGDWLSNTNYQNNDIVKYDNKIYVCIENHTSGTDIDLSKWTLWIDAKTAIENAIGNALDSKANINGDPNQKFKVANATEDDEAVNKKQLDNMTTKTESPKLSLNSISINERDKGSVNVTNYDSRLDYYVQSTDNNLATGIVTSDGTLQITTGDITDSVNHDVTLGVQSKAAGIPISDLTNIDVTVVYVPAVSDTTIQVIDINSDLEYNNGFEGVQ